jgi:hypothetical protein
MCSFFLISRVRCFITGSWNQKFCSFGLARKGTTFMSVAMHIDGTVESLKVGAC